eukprot:GFUD01005558.1.p1 GENE.GFUD01005558.1~~GFUD01005558.1.p1  ORF type:complete len:181 (+),score=24.89 GFUD01005558.1:42-584(+)
MCHHRHISKMEKNLLLLTSGGMGLGARLTPLASPVIKFTFDNDWTDWRPLTKPSSLKKKEIGQKKMSPSKYKKVRFNHVKQTKTIFISSKFFYPVAQLYHLDSWPSYLRLLAPAHLVLLFLCSLSMAIGGCLVYPLGFRTLGLLLWLVSSLIVSVLAVLGAAIMVKRGGTGGLGRILTRV